MTLVLLLSSMMTPAFGQEPVCEGRFALEEWREAMDAVDRAVAAGKGSLAKKILDQIHEALRCSEVLVDPRDLGRFARQMSVTAFSRQDDDEAVRWASLAAEAVPDVPWSDELPRTEAYVDWLDALKVEPQVAGPEGRGLVVPKRGGVLIDGRLATRAEASTSVPHLVQVADRSGQPVRAMWMDGAAFPEDLLGESVVVSRPDWYEDPDRRHREAAAAPEVGVAPMPISDDDEPPECPWKAIKKVEVASTTVTINKTIYRVRTEMAQAGFLDILYACQEFEAAGRFQKWRAARAINPFDGSMDRDAMVRALFSD